MAFEQNGAPALTASHHDETSEANFTVPEFGDTAPAEVEVEAPQNGGLRSYTPTSTARKAKKSLALKFLRRFTTEGGDPFNTVEWEKRTASITGEDGKIVFEQTDCEIPKSWSQLATNVVVSKYFRGAQGSPQRETSVRQVIGRVADTMHRWGVEGGYFASDEDAQAFRDELAYLLLHQYGSFNSPVWFNIGVEGAKQQASACFINSVHDDMESIMELASTEARLFKGGSGAGTNLWRIRSSKEHLSGGGVASGPVSFMRGWDAFAGAIKSGGTTRRAAKMVILNADHPDIEEFITCKAEEEKKAWALIDAGYNGGFNVPGGAYDSVDFQNANHSVRVTDEFMRAAENNADWSTHAVMDGSVVETKSARELLHKIAECTHICGDPGLQYDTTINDWHTSANTDRIYASNPCCVTGDTLVAVADGRSAVAIKDLVGQEVPVFAHDHASGKTTISRMWNIGVKRRKAAIHRVVLDDGSSFRATDDHLIMLRDGSYRQVMDLKSGDSLMPFHSKVLAPAKSRTKRRHIWTGASWQAQFRAIWEYSHGKQPRGHHIHHADFDALNDAPENLVLMSAEKHNALHAEKMRGDNNPARRLMTPEWKRNISRAMSGENNPNFGHTASEETRAVMREKAAARWSDPAQRAAASHHAKQWMQRAREEGRALGRPRGERFERCCPVCRTKFETPREAQIFCGLDCRTSPMGMQMCGEKTWSHNRGRALSDSHRAKLSAASQAGSTPSVKREAGLQSARNGVLRNARLLLDAGHAPTIGGWDELREVLREQGAARVSNAATVARHFENDAQLQEAAALYNHKVVSVEFCGHEDVYDGTVDTHHNFAIFTSRENSCADGHENFSGIFIHNSEFLFLDDTACNLASLNLMKFRHENGEFNAAEFIHACETFITAMEIIVSNASYPTEKIAVNSEDYRPLGLGYANLGALLMAQGTAYDSDEGRSLAGAITAIMTGAAYRQSARIAGNIGPFNGYAKNREPMLRVIGKHRDCVARIPQGNVPAPVLNAAQSVWDEALLLGQKHGYRNAQATVLAPTGTIAFMMDCDTTGIEPDIALVKYKKLVGGGLLKIVNQTVPEALRKLGYDAETSKEIVAYIDANDTIEGAPGLKDEHLSVFDCAFKAMNGTRSIHHMGHVKMMAAAQPFISGAISKTVNVPSEASVEEIMDAYIQSWKLGIKAVAIYRDGSKRTQPLSTASDAMKADALAKEAPRAVRRKLPDERAAVTHKFSIAGQEGYFTVGLYEDGSPGEIFIKMSKEGSTISGLMDSFAVAVSMCLQYGVPLRVLVNKFSHSRFEPSGYTTNKDIPIAKSLMDYIFRWFDLKFHPNGTNGHLGKHEAPAAPAQTSLLPEAGSTPSLSEGVHETDAPPCTECGTIMVRAGKCYSCPSCGTTSGCG
jgi:ribonucleotide reductase alpha subunit